MKRTAVALDGTEDDPVPSAPLVNWERLQRVMAEHEVDAVVATTPPNVTYLSDFWSLSHWSRRECLVFAVAARSEERAVEVVTPAGNADLLATTDIPDAPAVAIYGDFVVRRTEATEVRLTREENGFWLPLTRAEQRYDNPLSALTAALIRAAGAGSRVAIEAGGLPDGWVEEIRRRMPSSTLVPADTLLRAVRAVKTRREIDLLRRAARTTESVVGEVLASAAPGVNESALQAAYLRGVVSAGALPFLTSLTSGRRTALPNGQAGRRALRQGDIVRFDGGCRFRLYASDIARVTSVGEPSGRASRIYAALAAGVNGAIEAAKPGVRGAELFDIAVTCVRDSGLRDYARSHCGHGIGIENYDLPHIAPGSDDVLEPGMVLCLETPYYELGWGGLQAEDTLLVTDDGVERFTTSPDALPGNGFESGGEVS